MRGRKPKPTKLKLIEGNRGKRPLKKEPQAPTITANVAAPTFLDKIGREEWTRQLKILAPLGIVGACDLGILANYCDSYSDFVRASQKLKKTGDLTIVRGKASANPFLRIKRDARRDMIRAASELGISPASRARVTLLAREEEEDATAKFFE